MVEVAVFDEHATPGLWNPESRPRRLSVRCRLERRPSPEYAATGETRRALVRDARLMTDWSSVLASANPLRKG